jgi:tripeptide aminopeptidase
MFGETHTPSRTGRPRRDPTAQALADNLRRAGPVARACHFLEADDRRTIRDQRALTSVPAPPFGEAARASLMTELMAEAGLGEPELDAEGNVVARHASSGSAGGPPLVVSAHLDTVFPHGTPVEVREDGNRLSAPGIADDGRGLTALLALARALREGDLALEHPLLVVATVGEEGEGDLRGVRHLFSESGALGRGCAGFVSLDGAGLRRIVTNGLGCRRYRATVRGPGGHSWLDWGTPNPIHVLGRAVGELAALPLPLATTLSVGRWSGGTSINAIPTDAWIEFEIRSEEPEALAEVDVRAADLLRGVVAGGPLALTLDRIGDRPAGSTPTDAALVRAAAAATRAIGREPEFVASSSDANVPMALVVPALTLGAGGEAGQIHTPAEWYRNVGGPAGIQRALLTLLVADRLSRPAAASP